MEISKRLFFKFSSIEMYTGMTPSFYMVFSVVCLQKTFNIRVTLMYPTCKMTCCFSVDPFGVGISMFVENTYTFKN